MKNFIKGMLFVTLIIPLSDGLVSLFNQGIEYACTKIAAKTYQEKQKVQAMAEEDVPSSSFAMGFQAPDSNDEYEDDEEEEE